MKSTVEYLEPTRAKVTVSADYAELEPEMKKAYKEIAEQVNVPGFRKGKVPARIIDQRFGRGVVIDQVINEVLPNFYSQALMENKLRPLSPPEVEVTERPADEGEPGGELSFTAEVDVIPAFEMPELSGLTVEVPVIEISDEDVDEELDQLRVRFAALKTADRPAKDGDFLSLDLSVDVNGETIDSLSDVSYELGSASMLEGQDEALVGKSAGDEAVFVSTIRGGEHAGEEGDVTAKVLSVKERELPEVDEDFVQEVSEFDTVEELREDLKRQVSVRRAGDQALAARNALLDQLIDETEILLPEASVTRELEEAAGEDASEEDKAKLREQIEREIRQQVFLDELTEAREVNVGQQELMDFMMHTAQSYGINPAQLFQDPNQIQSMLGELRRTKALVSVLRDTKVVDTNGAAVDISEFTKEPEENVVVEETATDTEDN